MKYQITQWLEEAKHFTITLYVWQLLVVAVVSLIVGAVIF